ncbi:unnamed protein product [Closterium sp. NIES-64]|nr:unnamed protein product [Closterium sp. NIES-64]
MLNPGAALLLGSRHRLARDIQAYREAAREDMRQLLVGDGLAGRMSLTFDIWTSENNVAFMGVTAHYVTSDFQLKQAVIDFRELKGSHTGDLIADELEEVLWEWGLEKMLFAVTCDNTENNSRAMRLLAGVPDARSGSRPRHPPLLSRWRHFRCMAHVVNLAVQAALKVDEVAEPLKRLRDVANYIGWSTLRTDRFFELQKGYAATRPQGPPGSRRPSGPLRLIVDCLTRWGSTLHMVNRGFELRMPIAMVFDDSDVRMSHHPMHVPPSHACATIPCMSHHPMHVPPSHACATIPCMSHHPMHVPPSHACATIPCMSHHPMHVPPSHACATIPCMSHHPMHSSISKETKKAWDAIRLTDAHWDDLAKLRDFLTPFEQVTLFAEGSLYPTLSAVVPQYNALIDLKEKAQLTPGISPLRSSLITAALSKLERHMGGVSEEAAIATFLDPRQKLAPFKHRARAAEGNSRGATLELGPDRVKALVRARLPEYQAASTTALGDGGEVTSARGAGVHASAGGGAVDASANVSIQSQLFAAWDAMEAEEGEDPQDEVDQYLAEGRQRGGSALEYWRSRETLKGLRAMAKDYLGVPASSAASERAFSQSRNIITWQRHRLAAGQVRASMLIKTWQDHHPSGTLTPKGTSTANPTLGVEDESRGFPMSPCSNVSRPSMIPLPPAHTPGPFTHPISLRALPYSHQSPHFPLLTLYPPSKFPFPHCTLSFRLEPSHFPPAHTLPPSLTLFPPRAPLSPFKQPISSLLTLNGLYSPYFPPLRPLSPFTHPFSPLLTLFSPSLTPFPLAHSLSPFKHPISSLLAHFFSFTHPISPPLTSFLPPIIPFPPCSLSSCVTHPVSSLLTLFPPSLTPFPPAHSLPPFTHPISPLCTLFPFTHPSSPLCTRFSPSLTPFPPCSPPFPLQLSHFLPAHFLSPSTQPIFPPLHYLSPTFLIEQGPLLTVVSKEG